MPRRQSKSAPASAKARAKSRGPFVVGARLRELREARGWRQRDLMERVSLTQADISQLENDTPKDPRVSTVLDLCRAFEVSADYLLGLSNDPKPRG